MPAEIALHDGSHRAVGVGVAGPGTVTQLGHRVIHRDRPLVFDVLHGPVLVDMAPGAGEPVGGEFPCDRLTVPGMTAAAVNAGPVVHVGGRDVSVGDGRPERRAVARVARRGGDQNDGRLAFCRDTVVASRRRGRSGSHDRPALPQTSSCSCGTSRTARWWRCAAPAFPERPRRYDIACNSRRLPHGSCGRRRTFSCSCGRFRTARWLRRDWAACRLRYGRCGRSCTHRVCSCDQVCSRPCQASSALAPGRRSSPACSTPRRSKCVLLM